MDGVFNVYNKYFYQIRGTMNIKRIILIKKVVCGVWKDSRVFTIGAGRLIGGRFDTELFGERQISNNRARDDYAWSSTNQILIRASLDDESQPPPRVSR